MRGAVLRTYGVLWALTGWGMALPQFGMHPVRVGPPRDALRASAATAADLLAHNLAVALWPLGLALLGWARMSAIRFVGDVLVVGQLLGNGLLVGNALGQQPALWRYLPHLPFEWLGIAAPVGAWLLAREASGPSSVLPLAGVAVASLTAAAVLETWAVPL